MGNDFKIILEAMIDNSSLTNVQKRLAKERLKISADISVEDFAKSKQAIEKQIESLSQGIKTILGNAVTDKQASQWAKQYYEQMISGAKQAAKEQEKLNEAQRKNTLAEQTKYYQRIIDNNKTIYSLKNKLLNADTEQTAEINKQIKNLEQRNKYNNEQLSKKGLTDNSWERSVNDSKVTLENQLKINAAKVQDITNAKAVAQAEKEAAISVKERQILESQIDNILTNLNNKSYDSKLISLETSYTKLGLTSEEVKSKTNEVSVALDKLKEKNLDTLVKDEEDFANALKKSQNEASILKNDLEHIYNPTKQTKLSTNIQNWLSKNSAASREAKQTLQEYYRELSSGRVSVDRLEYIEQELKTIDATQRGLGKLGKNLKDQFSQAATSFTQWISVSSAIMGIVYKTKQATTELKNLNSILTEISKTSDLTNQQLKDLGNSAFESASKYGRTASDYLTAVQEMSRSGFYGEKGTAMAEQSLLAQASGDMSSELANNYLLATNAAYKLNGEAEKLNAVLDGQNSITNKNSVAMEDMATIMTKAGSVAANYRVSIEQLSALGGTIEAVTKLGGEEVGTGVKSLLINLQNISSSKIVGTLNKANASMTEFVNGTEKLRNPIDILRDLSKTFQELDENDALRAEILTNIGGKYQANKLAAILDNMDLYDKMLQDYANGAGSALEEANKSANNWEGSLNRLSNTWTDTVGNIENSDGIIATINGLNDLLEIVNKLTSALGSFGTISMTASGILGAKGLGLTNCVTLS